MKRSVLVLALLVPPLAAGAAEGANKTYRGDHTVVLYSGIDEKYAKAIAEVVEAARAVAVEQYGFDMPDTVSVSVTAGAAKRPRLFNDGQDRLYLSVRSARDLRQPRYSGIYNIYGLCHEVGHLAMYRLIRDRSWMTTAAAEGWAHWLGSRVVDAVYEKLGQEVWPDRYDYRADGTARLKRQLASRPSAIAKGAGQWMELAGIIGPKAFVGLFKAWGQAEVDPHDPAAALRRGLLAVGKDERLGAWWNAAESLFVQARPKSGFAARTAKPGDLAGDPVELAHDDGKPADKKSIAGGGHAVRFDAKGTDWYLTAVRIHGSRYGHPRPPKEDFHVYLCDADFKQIADFPAPYARFARGEPRWVTVEVTPTQVPPKFIVCVGFNPTGTKGVFVSRDAEAEGDCLIGLPTAGGQAFREGDWLIRADLDRPRSADALGTQR
ncbi:MAG: hypothetical protein WBF17_01400 [Phycisphaerae bacterium]